MTRITILALAGLALFAGTADAARTPRRVNFVGPATIVGPGPVRGLLKAAAGAAPVTFTANGKGGIALVDRAGDLKVDCAATGGATTKTRKNGKVVQLCKGDATVTGSGFAFAVRGLKYELAIPAGYKGAVRTGRHARPKRGDGAAGASDTGSASGDQSVAAAEAALGDSGA